MTKKILLLICLIIVSLILGTKLKNIVSPAVHIQFASWGSESEIKILKPILADFEKENPDIKVEFLHIPQNYFQKIHLLFASNTAPDVIFINNQYLPIYANADVLEDLTPYSNDLQFDDFYKKSLEAMSWNGKIYAVPRDVSNLVIFYNKSLFDKYGVNYPENDWDYEKFLSIAKKLTNKNVWGISFEEDPLYYLPFLTGNGGWTRYDTENYFKTNILNKPKNKYGLDFYANLRKKYHYAPKREESGSATMAQMFLQERLGMYISGRWMVPKLRQEAKFDWDVVPFPAEQTGSVVPLDASGWAVAKSSKHKEQALKLVKYLSSDKSSNEFTRSGLIVPSRIDVSRSKVFLDNQKPENSQVFLDIIETSVPTPVTLNYREILDDLKIKTEFIFN